MDSLFDLDKEAPRTGFDPGNYLLDIQEYLKNHPIIYPTVDESLFTQSYLSQLARMDWLNNVSMTLFSPTSTNIHIQRTELIEDFVNTLKLETVVIKDGFSPVFPKGYSERLISLDLETTSLDTRIRYDENGELIRGVTIVGVCIAISNSKGFYLPVQHTQTDGILNWNYELIIEFLSILNSEFSIIYHNGQYDREVESINGVQNFRPYPYFFDTQLLSFINDVNNKTLNLKDLSERLLNRPMIKIEQLFGYTEKKGSVILFNRLTASISYVYGCSDALNTYGIFQLYASQPKETNIFLQQAIPIQIDHKMVDSVRALYRHGLPINIDYFVRAMKDTVYRIHLTEQAIYEVVGKKFDVNSNKQVSTILFDEIGIPATPEMVQVGRNKLGVFSVAEETLELLYELYPDYLALKYIVLYRKLCNTMTKIYKNAIINSFVCSYLPYTRVQLQFSQTNVPTGRFSSSSNKGTLHQLYVKYSDKGKQSTRYEMGTGDAGFNSQGINSKITHRLGKARKIKKIPENSELNLENVYPEFIHQEFIKELVSY